MFRMYPTAGYNQPVIDLIVEMMQEHGLKTADLEMVEVSMNYIENLYPSPEAFGRADSRRATYEIGERLLHRGEHPSRLLIRVRSNNIHTNHRIGIVQLF